MIVTVMFASAYFPRCRCGRWRPMRWPRGRSPPTSSSPTGSATTSVPSSARATVTLAALLVAGGRGQFYLCWPLLLVVLARRPNQYRRLVLTTIGVLATASFVVGLWLTARRPSWAFFLLPARMGELLAGAGTGASRHERGGDPSAWRGAIGWFGVLGIVIACFGFDETIPWPGAAVLLVVATMAVIVAGASTSPPWAPATGLATPRCSGSAVTPTPSTSGTGRRSCSPQPNGGRSTGRSESPPSPSPPVPRRCPCASSRTRCATPATSALSWRSLSLGLAMCVLVIGVGWDLRASSIRLDGGVQAAAPQLAPATTTVTPSALAAAPTSVAPTTTAAVATSTDPVTLAT